MKKNSAKKSVLVVDDDDDLRELLVEILSASGYRVVTAKNGKEGEKVYRSAPTHLVVTDIMMPEEDGLEMIRNLRRDYPDIRIIAMSAGSGRRNLDYLSMVERFGAARIVPKPFTRDTILKAVAETVEQPQEK